MDVVISGTGLFTPAQSISNEELVESFNQFVDNYNRQYATEIESGAKTALVYSDTAFIEKASGIKSRFVMDKAGILDPERMVPHLYERANEEASVQCEMSVGAARQALAAAKRSANDVDFLVIACSNLQRPYPAVSIEVQAALGITGAAYDMNVACSSATFGIEAAVNAVKAGSANVAMVISPEICTGHLNFRDRDSHFIFGDACTAVVVERADSCSGDRAFEVLGTQLQTIYSNNIRNNFGFLNRADESGIGTVDKLFVQNGRKVFKEVVPAVAEQISNHLQVLDIPSSKLKRMWLHQANLAMNQLIGKKVLGRAANEQESPIILDEYANTSSAGSIIAFHKYQDDFATGDLGVICSFGAGYSIGSVVVRKS
jgi:beta-ketodecanoyl-[acyl-carrier-protein] synthase